MTKSRLRRLIAPPSFADAEQSQRAEIFHRVVLTTLAFASPVLALIPVVQPAVWGRALFALVTVNSLGFALLEVNRRGRTELASKILVIGLITLVTVTGVTAGGIRSPGVTMYFIFVLMAGLLLGFRAGTRAAFVCGSLSLGLVLLERGGGLPAPWAPYQPETFWLLNCFYLGLTLALLRIATDVLARALESERRRRESEAQLRQSQKMEALGTLAGGIAHDFNNILMAIIGNAELAIGELKSGTSAHTSVDEIRRASVRAGDLVKRILLFSRRQEADHKSLAVVPIVEEAVKLIRFSLAKSIHVRTLYAPDVPPVSGDVSQLSQVVMNLATNAAHAMGESGGTLSVQVDVAEVGSREAATDLPEGRYVRVSVRDTGVGMSRAVLDRIFEPFYTTKGHEGTGLGLSVVHGILQEHRGAIRIESEPGKGTTARVYLPAATTAPARRVSPVPTEQRGGGEQIMYVDDEEVLIDVMTRSLRVLGYRCIGFTDPVAALAEFRNSPFAWAAVITDLSMPQMSGLELAREMRDTRPDVRIAMVSGYTSDLASLREAGIATRLQKPYTIDAIGAVLHELLSGPAVAVGD